MADLYGEVVRIADGPEAFVAAVRMGLDEAPQERAARVKRGRSLLAR